MDFEVILPIVLKVLGCAVGIYLIAGFLVSLTKLLPFLAILSSVGTILSINFVRGGGDESMLWLPLALTLLTQLFYHGEGYMNPKIHENVYSLVNVERKYNSIFAEFDNYELHFRAFETGGFIENTLIFGIIFGLYYNFLLFPNPDTWYVYILPVYLLMMSVVDALGVIGILRPAPFFYGALRILVCIIAVAIGFLGGPSKTGGFETNKIYNEVKDITVFDFDNTSYRIYYEHLYYDGYKNHQQNEFQFIYDADLDVGAEYRSYSSGRVYDYLYVEDGDELVKKLENVGNDTPSWIFVQTETDNGTPLKYFKKELTEGPTAPPMPDFSRYLPLSVEKVDNTKYFRRDSTENTYQIEYISEYDSTYDKENLPRYSVYYRYRTDDKGKPIEFVGFYCEVHVDEHNIHSINCSIINGDTGIETLYENGALKGADYGEKRLYGIDFTNALGPFNGTTGTIGNYDLCIDEIGDETSVYAYDKESGMIAIYQGEDCYTRLFNAGSTKDFVTYPPDYYVSTVTRELYDAEFNLVDEEYEHQSLTHIFKNAFNTDFDGRIAARKRHTDAGVVTLTRTLPGSDSEIRYNFDIKRDGREYEVETIYILLEYGGRDYSIRIDPDGEAYDFSAQFN